MLAAHCAREPVLANAARDQLSTGGVERLAWRR
ncbi:hypothetical protein FHS42_006378 [Streptomyces zagrosensis]|uniref:Uncharacterized protein n=1 Tax=Streptomyces zagrosensis TaxID=1042984 RepID=A0A7W9V1J9_9ACTN|nr:hypothetical protein [Streptomyces zagrosensis]